LAGLLSKLLNGYTVEKAMEFASATGALIASYNGACPDYQTNEITELINSSCQFTSTSPQPVFRLSENLPPLSIWRGDEESSSR
jgi:hypothetical protein